MRVFITDPAARVSVREGCLTVLLDGHARGSWPLEQLTAVSCFGPIHWSGQGLAKLVEAGIRLDLFSAQGRYRGSLTDGQGGSLFIRMAHHDRWRDADFRLILARGFVQEKLLSQLHILKQWPEVDEAGPVGERLSQCLVQVREASSIERLMGLEGQAATDWFTLFAKRLPVEVPFGGRSRRPPLDAPNALLSLGYTLLGTELAGMLEASGLDASLAFLHGFRFGRLSLAYDLLEEVRQPVIDRWVLRLFSRRQVRLEDFEAREGGVYLRRESFREVLKHYQTLLGRFGEAGSVRGSLQRRVDQLVNAVLDRAPMPAREPACAA